MLANRVASALAIGAALSLGGLGSAALAADMLPVKALKAPPPEPLDIHAFSDVTYLNDYITPRGLLVTNTGLTTQVLGGTAIDLYKDKSGFINDFSINYGVWGDFWSEQHDIHVDAFNEFDWWAAFTVTFAKNWTFGAQYIEFIPPAADLATSFPSIEHNIEFSLAYDDTGMGFPIPLHPYVKLFYEISGPSTVVLGKKGDTFDVEIGVVPTIDAKMAAGMPLTITFPTWFTVGPTDYWNNGAMACGPLSSSPCATSNLGVVTTGIQGKLALDGIVPKRLGSWYLKAGARYYHVLNDALLAAQEFTGAAGGSSGVFGTFPNAHRDIGVVYVGNGISF
jgi:hypothetical protein